MPQASREAAPARAGRRWPALPDGARGSPAIARNPRRNPICSCSTLLFHLSESADGGYKTIAQILHFGHPVKVSSNRLARFLDRLRPDGIALDSQLREVDFGICALLRKRGFEAADACSLLFILSVTQFCINSAFQPLILLRQCAEGGN